VPPGLVGRDFCAQQDADAVGYSLRGDRLEEAENIEGVLVLAPARDVDPFGNLMELGDKEGGGARDRYLECPSVVYFQGFDDPLLPIDERGLEPSRLSGGPVAVRTETRSAAARTAYGFGHHEIDLYFYWPAFESSARDPGSDVSRIKPAHALWLDEKTLTVEHRGRPLSRYDVRYAAGTAGKLAAVSRPELFETPFVTPQPRLFDLPDAGWLKALRLLGYAPRKRREPMLIQDVLFPYLEAL
jgi:hypothetical protein